MGPQLLVCLPVRAAVWCSVGAGWLAGHTGVGHLNVAVSSSVDGLWSDVLMLAFALFILISW